MGAFKRRPLLGTLVPVEEPSTASEAEVEKRHALVRSSPESGHSPTQRLRPL